MKKNFKEKVNEIKEKHPKLVKFTKRVIGVVAIGGAAGLIGYEIGKQTGFGPTDLTDGTDETDELTEEIFFDESSSDEVVDKEVSG